MASPPKKTFAAKANLLTSLVLVLPLLVFYEIGVLASQQLNGADLVTTRLIRLVGVNAFIWIQVGLVLSVLAIAGFLRRRQQFNLGQVAPVLLESTIYALTMGTLIVFVMVDLLGIDPRLAASGPLANATVFQKLVMSVGAGVHEELLFRLILMGGLLWIFQKTGMVQNRVLALVIALAISALLFSAAHHIGPLGDPLKLGVFVYRAIAGIFFGLLYHFRGFAIAVYTHAIYDIYVMVFG